MKRRFVLAVVLIVLTVVVTLLFSRCHQESPPPLHPLDLPADDDAG